MAVSKKRKKKGKPVKRGTDRPSGLTLQDLINVVAYQELHPEEAASEPVIVDEAVGFVATESHEKDGVTVITEVKEIKNAVAE